MKESLNSAPEGHTAEYYRSPEQLERDKLLTLAILDNYLDIQPDHLDRYASVPVEEAFDWNEVYDKITQEHEMDDGAYLDIFAFHSQPNPQRDAAALDRADLDAFIATRDEKPDDFMYYYREGIIDNSGNVLSFCVWTDRDHAHVLKKNKAHEHAAQYAHSSYNQARTQWLRISRAGKGQEVTIEKSEGHSLSVGH